MSSDSNDALALAFEKASNAAFSLEQAFLENGDNANAVLADGAVQKLSSAATQANALSASQKLSSTEADRQILQRLTDKVNTAAGQIAASEAQVRKWVNVATNATQLVGKVASGNIGGAISNAQSIVSLLS
jgi:uncharacterized protein (DUF58 family)